MNLIFARGLNGEFALPDGSLPWKNCRDLEQECRDDMLHFKNMTKGNIVIMGWNTSRTFPAPLPERLNIVIDRNSKEPDSVDIETFNYFPTMETALAFIQRNKIYGKIFLIGGTKLISTALEKNLVDEKIYESIFDHDFPEAEIFIPSLPQNWKLISESRTGKLRIRCLSKT